jgi:dihydrofolate synthase/folylpolyglutamate synthase
VGPQLPEVLEVLARVAGNVQAPLYRSGQEWSAVAVPGGFHFRAKGRDVHFPLPNLAGEHQVANAGTAIACTGHLSGFTITDDHIREGITHAVWPARLQRLTEGSLARLMPRGSELWLDGGHNPGAGEVLARWAKNQKKPVHLICGMLKTKDAAEFLKPIAPYVRSLTAVTIEDEPSAQAPEAIEASAKASAIAVAEPTNRNDIKNVIESIVRNEESDNIILICGSLYLAGNILWQNGKPA